MQAQRQGTEGGGYAGVCWVEGERRRGKAVIKVRRDKQQVTLEFGMGDIEINSGYVPDEGKGMLGLILLRNQVPRPIGERTVYDIPRKVDREDYPVVMTFSSAKSIDSLITELLSARRHMEGLDWRVIPELLGGKEASS